MSNSKKHGLSLEQQAKVTALIEHVTDNSEIVILSYGMGVESTAILLRWIYEPETCPVDLNKLIVITSQLGDEWPDTYRDVDQHCLPLLREKGIRFVQVARKGHNQQEGIDILDDSRTPATTYMPNFKLSDELRSAGTVPQAGGEHRCSLKFKAWVIEQWLDLNVREPARHAFGYNTDEQRRIDKCENAFVERIAFGFNTGEMKRVDNSCKYDTATRVGFYPLLDWKWSRQDCIDYIQQHTGIIWRKSACCYCPFAKNKQNMDELLARHREFPDKVATSLFLEHLSLSLNYRGTLFADKALYDIVHETANNEALQLFEAEIQSYPWAKYRVRRLYTAPGKASRAVERIADYSNRQIASDDLFAHPLGTLETKRNITYDYVEYREPDTYPAREEFYTVAPGIIPDKTRYGIHHFNSRWAPAIQIDLFSLQLPIGGQIA